MCGRFGQISKPAKYISRFGLNASEMQDVAPNYNTDIGSEAIIISPEGDLKKSMFGFTPAWSQKLIYLFNARCEGDFNPTNDQGYEGEMGIFDKPSFRHVIKSQRAVVPLDYFVEGPEKERLKKPFIVQRKDKEPFLLAAIYNPWKDKETGELIHTFAILTTAANKLVAKVGHHRCPLVLASKQLQDWFNPNASIDELSKLMRPFDGSEYEAYPVDPQIGKRNTKKSPNNDADLIVPIGEKPSKSP